MDAETLKGRALTRRSALARGTTTTFLLSQAALFEQLVTPPARPAGTAAAFPDIQFSVGPFTHEFATPSKGAGSAPAQSPVVFTLFQPAALTRPPSLADQAMLADTLATIETEYLASPSGVLISSVSYGVPYFNMLPSSLVTAHMPRLASDTSSFVLSEAVPSPADVVDGLVGGRDAPVPGVTKDRFNVNVMIESNDVLFQFRSDNLANLADVVLWLEGSNSLNGAAIASPSFSGLFSFQAPRIQFCQAGLPRKVADRAGLEFASRIDPGSCLATGGTGPRPCAGGPPQMATFAGNSPARLTGAKAGDYFDNGSIAHFSHVIDDMYEFCASPALVGARDGRFCGESAQQPSPRAGDGPQLHIRMDGPGFDGMDVPQFQDFPGGNTIPAGTPQFKRQVIMFGPAAGFFAHVRAAVEPLRRHFLAGDEDGSGAERFSTATRRQNFLVPPRRHRVFPLLELT